MTVKTTISGDNYVVIIIRSVFYDDKHYSTLFLDEYFYKLGIVM